MIDRSKNRARLWPPGIDPCDAWPGDSILNRSLMSPSWTFTRVLQGDGMSWIQEDDTDQWMRALLPRRWKKEANTARGKRRSTRTPHSGAAKKPQCMGTHPGGSTWVLPPTPAYVRVRNSRNSTR